MNSKEWSWFRVLSKVEQINDNLVLRNSNNESNKKCMYEWDDEAIRNDNEVKKAEQGQ